MRFKKSGACWSLVPLSSPPEMESAILADIICEQPLMIMLIACTIYILLDIMIITCTSARTFLPPSSSSSLLSPLSSSSSSKSYHHDQHHENNDNNHLALSSVSWTSVRLSHCGGYYSYDCPHLFFQPPPPQNHHHHDHHLHQHKISFVRHLLDIC